MRTSIPMIVLCLLLAGCGADNSEPDVQSKGETTAVQTSGEEKPETVFSGQIDAMDKARQVESTLLEAAEKESRQIEQSTE